VSVLEDLRGIEDRLVARLQELRPLVEEYAELQRVAERLGVDVDAAPTKPPARRRKPTAKPAARRPRRKRRADSRKRPGGTQATGAERRERVIALIRERPGISTPEIAADIGVDPPPIYRVVRRLQADGVIKKDGKALQLA
jgi:ribosome-binding protein aMBF1 (putative translation factor)